MSARAFSFPLSVREKYVRGHFSVRKDPIWAGKLAKANNGPLMGALIVPKMCRITVQLCFDFNTQKTNQGHWVSSLDVQSYIRITGSGCGHQCIATQRTSQVHGARGERESINHQAAALTRRLLCRFGWTISQQQRPTRTAWARALCSSEINEHIFLG